MGGTTKISTPAVIKSSPRFPYLRSKIGIVSGATPKLSGHLTIGLLEIKRLCFLTCRAVVVSLTKRGMRYNATVAMDLFFKENMVPVI